MLTKPATLQLKNMGDSMTKHVNAQGVPGNYSVKTKGHPSAATEGPY